MIHRLAASRKIAWTSTACAPPNSSSARRNALIVSSTRKSSTRRPLMVSSMVSRHLTISVFFLSRLLTQHRQTSARPAMPLATQSRRMGTTDGNSNSAGVLAAVRGAWHLTLHLHHRRSSFVLPWTMDYLNLSYTFPANN